MKSKQVTMLGITAFLIMSFWGIHSMPSGDDGKMGNCPLTNDASSLCQMSVTEHIARWQQLFTVTQEKSTLLFLLFLLVFLFIALFPISARARDKPPLQRLRNCLYQHKPEIKLFNHLLLAFSDGILNPKIYEDSVL